MSPRIYRRIEVVDAHQIEDLSAATIRGVAERLLLATNFEDFVRRESEMDALFTLADIAITTDRGAANGERPTAHLVEVRRLVFAAHDATHESDLAGAAGHLSRAAEIVERHG